LLFDIYIGRKAVKSFIVFEKKVKKMVPVIVFYAKKTPDKNRAFYS